MLDDELTLLDGTNVVTAEAVARLTSEDFWYTQLLLSHGLQPETVLDGSAYYERDAALTLVAGRR